MFYKTRYFWLRRDQPREDTTEMHTTATCFWNQLQPKSCTHRSKLQVDIAQKLSPKVRDLFFFFSYWSSDLSRSLISSLETKTVKILFLFLFWHLLKSSNLSTRSSNFSPLETKTTVQALCSSTVKVFLLYSLFLVFINLIKKLLPLTRSSIFLPLWKTN